MWMKKIRGRLYYFGRWGRIVDGKMERLPEDGWELALKLFDAQKDDLYAGRVRPKPAVAAEEPFTIEDLTGEFLQAKSRKLDAGEMVARSYWELRATADYLLRYFGKDRLVESLEPKDFGSLRADIAKRCGPVRLGGEITRIRSIFKYAVDNKLVAEPTSYGSEFVKPDKATLRKHKATSAKKLFTAGEIRALLAAANPLLKAVIYLGINTGAGNTDIAYMEHKHVDLDSGWLDYARRKTGIDRRVPLWPETVSAIKAALAVRPKPKHKADTEIVLLNPNGERLVRMHERSRTDEVTTSIGKLLRTLKINGRKGLGFYSLRHTFASIGLQTKDRDAVKALMGHAHGDILEGYDETGPSDERRLAVTNHVRSWLFDGKGGGK
jgi:integrase